MNKYQKHLLRFAATTLDEPKEYKECYVGFLDILGFKAMLETQECSKIKSLYDEIRASIELVLYTDLFAKVASDTAIKNLSVKLISDSIVISIPKNKQGAFHSLLILCLALQDKLLRLKTPVLLRGGIGLGNFYSYNEMMFGPVLSEVVNLEETIKMPQIIIRKQVFVDGILELKGDNLAFVKAFTAEDGEFVFLDSIKMIVAFNNSSSEIRNNLKTHITTYAQCTDKGIREKYVWLLERYDKIIKEFDI